MFISGLVVEVVTLIITIVLMYHSLKKNGLKFTFILFTVLFCAAVLIEGLCIMNNFFFYKNFNFYILSVPIAVIFYWSLFYLLLLFYEWLVKKKINVLIGLLAHFLIDAFITTPLFIIAGFWTVSGTLFSSYPYFSPLLHTLEAIGGLFLSLLFLHIRAK